MKKETHLESGDSDVPYVIHEETLDDIDGGAVSPGGTMSTLATGEENRSRFDWM
jgi:hypothetical protein